MRIVICDIESLKYRYLETKDTTPIFDEKYIVSVVDKINRDLISFQNINSLENILDEIARIKNFNIPQLKFDEIKKILTHNSLNNTGLECKILRDNKNIIYLKESFYLLSLEVENDFHITESYYSIYKLKVKNDLNWLKKSTEICSLHPIQLSDYPSIDKSMDGLAQLDTKEWIHFPEELVREFFQSFLVNFEMKNVLLNQSIFRVEDLQEKITAFDFSLALKYPDSCKFDLDGRAVNTRKLIDKGILIDFIHSNLSCSNDYGDCIDYQDSLPIPCFSGGLDLSLPITKCEFKYIADWRNSTVYFDSIKKIVFGNLTVFSKFESKLFCKTFAIDIMDFLDGLFEYRDDSCVKNETIQNIITKI